MDLFQTTAPEDARIALRIWTRELTSIYEEGYRGEVRWYEQAAEAVEDVQTGQITMINLLTPDYRNYRQAMRLTPSVVAVDDQGRVTDRCLLIVRDDSPFHDWASLQGVEILVGTGLPDRLPLMWADVSLHRVHLGRAAEVFQLRRVDRASRAALPVFFRQSEAAIVYESSLATIAEMNPQVGRELRVVATSPALLSGFMSFAPGASPQLRAAIMSSAATIDATPQGRQILELFGRSAVVPFESRYLAPSLELIAAHERLPGSGRSEPRLESRVRTSPR